MAKSPTMREDVAVIRTKVEGIEEHLGRLNGTVARHESDISKLKYRWAYFLGVGAAVMFGVEVFVNHFL